MMGRVVQFHRTRAQKCLETLSVRLFKKPPRNVTPVDFCGGFLLWLYGHQNAHWLLNITARLLFLILFG